MVAEAGPARDRRRRPGGADRKTGPDREGSNHDSDRSLSGLTRRYRDQLALDDISLDIEDAAITGSWVATAPADDAHAHRRGAGIRDCGPSFGSSRQPS